MSTSYLGKWYMVYHFDIFEGRVMLDWIFIDPGMAEPS